MKKLKIIFNLITLALTTGLLVMITVAWYAVNKQASVEAGAGSIADLDKIIDKVEYYNFESLADDGHTYRVKNYVLTQFGENPDQYQIDFTYNDQKQVTAETETGIDFHMNPYDYLSKDITKYLIKITLLPSKSYSSLQFRSTACYFIGFNASNDSDGSVEEVDSLSMSSVIKFGCYTSNYPTIQANNGHDNATVVLSAEPTYNHFEYTYEYTQGGTDYSIEYYGAITAPTKVISTGPTGTPANPLELYILIDYNLDELNAFYSYNLATTGSWGNPLVEGHGSATAPQFVNKDFTIFILG